MNICVVGGKDFKLLPKPLGETPEIFQSLHLNYISKITRTVWRAIIRNMSEWMQFSGKVPHTFLANTLLYWETLDALSLHELDKISSSLASTIM